MGAVGATVGQTPHDPSSGHQTASGRSGPSPAGNEARCATRSLQNTSETVIPLADIADVVLETETTQWPRGPYVTDYRLAYLLANGEHVPWVPYLNGTRSDKIMCLYAAKAFLRRAAARAPEGLVFANRVQASAGVQAASERSSC